MSLLQRPEPHPSSERGFTLVELLVVIVIMGIVGTMMVAAITQTSKIFVQVEEEGDGLGQAKTVMDRVTRDIREANQVVCDGLTPGDPGCERHLELWIDDDGDYLGPPHGEDPGETVTWSIEASADGVHCDVIRTQDGDSATIARSLVIDAGGCQTFFTYDPPAPADPSEATAVTITMTYDPSPGAGVDPKTAATTVNLRNAESS